MTHTALIQFAPVWTFERHNDPKWNRPGRCLYSKLGLLPGRDTAPVLVDHDDDREVGRVLEIFRMDWVDGPWWCARAEIDKPPGWLRKRETKVSFGFIPTLKNSFTSPAEADHYRKAWVTEVSVLSPSVKPVEPLAHVVLLDAQASPAVRDTTSGRSAAGEVIHHEPVLARREAVIRPDPDREELLRRMEWVERRTGRQANFEAVLEGLKAELYGPSLQRLVGVR